MIRRRLLFVLLLLLLVTGGAAPASLTRDAGLFYVTAPDQNLLDRTVAVLAAARDELTRQLGAPLTDSIRVYIADSRYDFDTTTFGAVPDWGVGCAIPERRMIAVLSPHRENFDLPFDEVLRHELAHLALSARVAGRRLPRFMDEGFAMTFAHEWGFGDDLVLARARFTGSLLTLSQIDDVNLLNPAQARIAYAQSFQALKYIQDVFGREVFLTLLDGFREGKTRDRVFQEVLGTDFAGFNKLFAEYLTAHYSWLMLFTDPLLLWILLALIVIVGFILIRLRRRKVYRKWEEEEKFESTDFDYEEPSPWD